MAQGRRVSVDDNVAVLELAVLFGRYVCVGNDGRVHDPFLGGKGGSGRMWVYSKELIFVDTCMSSKIIEHARV